MMSSHANLSATVTVLAAIDRGDSQTSFGVFGVRGDRPGVRGVPVCGDELDMPR